MIVKTACVSPEWFQKGSVYQVNPRTFSAEGTIAAVTKALPRLAEMGFSVIYFCPLFEADTSEDRDFWSIRQKASNTNNPKNPYRMMDYFRIDDEYGALDDLRACIQTAHVTRRMQIIRTLNTLRKTVCALSAGETVWLETPKEILVFERRAKDGTAVFIANFGKTTQTVSLPDGIADTLLSNKAVADDTTVTLQPYGYIAYMKG